jgi:hypothetical protein
VARSTLGIELGDPRFWHECLDLVEQDLAAFARLAPG